MDERLRRLQRAAQTRPDDHEAGRSYALALEQAGNSAGAWLAWCALGRAGDHGAWGALDRSLRGVRAKPKTVAVRTLPTRDHRPAYCWICTDRDVVVLLGHGALDLRDLSTRWSTAAQQTRGAISGPRACLVGPDAAMVHDLQTGAELGRCPMPSGETPVIEEVMASGDRLVVRWRDFRLRGETRLITIDLGASPGTVITDLQLDEALLPHCAVAGLVLLDDQRDEDVRSVTASTIDEGRDVWTAEGQLIKADVRGALLTTWRYDDDDRAGEPVQELDLVSGERRWSLDDVFPGRTVLTPGFALRFTTRDPWHGGSADDEVFRCVAIDRATGEIAWQLRERVGRHVVLDARVTDDVVYLALGLVDRRELPPKVHAPRVIAVDIANGKRLFTQAVEVAEGWESSRLRALMLVPSPEALVVVSVAERSTRVERWTAGAGAGRPPRARGRRPRKQ